MCIEDNAFWGLWEKCPSCLLVRWLRHRHLQRVRWGMQVGKMERVLLKKIVGIYQLKGKHISQVWEVKKESCFSALISCNVKIHCTTDLWKAQVFTKRTYIKCILKNSVSSLVYFYFDFWVFLPHSMTISAGSWVDGLQELLRVPWHLFRWVKEGAAGCMIQHFIKSCGFLRPPGWWAVPCAQDGASLERTPLSVRSCLFLQHCLTLQEHHRELLPGGDTPDLWVLQGDGSHASGLKGQEMLTGSCMAEREAGPASQHTLDQVNFTAV